MKRQFVSTCYVVDGEKFLLHFHKKHGKWLPPGGHLEENETPPEGARREVFEETGLEIAFIKQENLWYDQWNGHSIERPFLCLLEHIPKQGEEAAHQHIDMIFVARPIGGTLTDGKWMSLSEVLALEPHKEIFLDTQLVIERIFHTICPIPESFEVGK